MNDPEQTPGGPLEQQVNFSTGDEEKKVITDNRLVAK